MPPYVRKKDTVIKTLRKTVFRSTQALEEQTGISCRTWQAFEQGRLRPERVYAFTFILELMLADPEIFRRLLAKRVPSRYQTDDTAFAFVLDMIEADPDLFCQLLHLRKEHSGKVGKIGEAA